MAIATYVVSPGRGQARLCTATAWPQADSVQGGSPHRQRIPAYQVRNLVQT